jgi:hypothetical protein
MRRCSAEEAAALLRPRDTMILGFGPAQLAYAWHDANGRPHRTALVGSRAGAVVRRS